MMSKNTFTLGVLPTTFLCNTSFHNLFYHSQYFPKGKYKASLFFPAQIGSISRLVLSKLIVSILLKFSNETGLKTKSLSWKKKKDEKKDISKFLKIYSLPLQRGRCHKHHYSMLTQEKTTLLAFQSSILVYIVMQEKESLSSWACMLHHFRVCLAL